MNSEYGRLYSSSQYLPLPNRQYHDGEWHHVVVQSMITEETRNVDACVEQIIGLHKIGCEVVRVTTPSLGEAQCLEEIKAKVREQYQDVPRPPTSIIRERR